jgi:hypothetical protein
LCAAVEEEGVDGRAGIDRQQLMELVPAKFEIGGVELDVAGERARRRIVEDEVLGALFAAQRAGDVGGGARKTEAPAGEPQRQRRRQQQTGEEGRAPPRRA